MRTTRARTWLAVLASSTLAAACGAGERADGWAGQVDTLAGGAVRVRNPALPLLDSARAWRLEEDLRIGSTDVEGPDLFGHIAGMVVDSAGRILVVDRQAKQLRIFGPDGVHMRTVGREGSGPGEFRDPIGIALAPDGHVWVVDAGNGRFSIHDSAGEFVETRPRAVGGYSVPWRGGFDAMGRFWEATVASNPDGLHSVIVRFDGALQARDTLVLPDLESSDAFELRTQGGYIAADVPFTPDRLWALGPEGVLWLAGSGDYRLYATRAGDTLRIVERAFEPVPVTAEERDEAIARLQWFVRQGGEVDPSRIPDTRPILRRFTVDSEGELWVSVNEPGDPAGAAYDVFDTEGRYLTRVRSPFELLPEPLFRGAAVYGRHTDELGVEHVVRLRLVRPD